MKWLFDSERRRPSPEARIVFPVRDLVRHIILGNLIAIGGVFLIEIGRETLEGAYSWSEIGPRFAGNVNGVLYGFLGILRSDFGWFFFVGPGTLGGTIWYIVDRYRETRHLRRRFGVVANSRSASLEDKTGGSPEV